MVAQRRLLECAELDQLAERDRQRDVGSGDGRAAGAAIGLEHVAIEDDAAFA